LISYLTTILTKKNEVYQKYSDDECNTKQFDDAYKNIVDDNKKRRHRIPKPTHHIIIPFEEEINGLKYEKGKNSEQKMILNFSNYIIENNAVKKLLSEPKVQFVKDLCDKIIFCLEKSENKELYNSIFETGNYKKGELNTKTDYDERKAFTEYFDFFKKNSEKLDINFYKKLSKKKQKKTFQINKKKNKNKKKKKIK